MKSTVEKIMTTRVVTVRGGRRLRRWPRGCGKSG
jgi:hypothetical protein